MPIKSEINFKLVSRVIGNLLLVESGALFFVLLITFLYSESDGIYFIYSGLISLLLAFCFFAASSTLPSKNN